VSADFGAVEARVVAFLAREERLVALERREVITTDPARAEECCGIPRDRDGMCQHRLYHPAYVPGGPS
jgi:hypothetical protein